MLDSHSRFHGTTPREPWFFGEAAERIVRSWMNLRYQLLPDIERLCTEAAGSTTRRPRHGLRLPRRTAELGLRGAVSAGRRPAGGSRVETRRQVRVYFPKAAGSFCLPASGLKGTGRRPDRPAGVDSGVWPRGRGSSAGASWTAHRGDHGRQRHSNSALRRVLKHRAARCWASKSGGADGHPTFLCSMPSCPLF